MTANIRIGHGYDVHRLVPNRRLILGGVDIPNEFGLLGHSDADVLTHAIMDAILGALGEGDIGKHFPDAQKEFENISSIHLLTRVKKIMEKHGAQINNIDSTVILQRPKIAAHIDNMKNNIAFALNISPDIVNVKATTEEGLGFTGAEQGVAAHAVVLLSIDNNN